MTHGRRVSRERDIDNAASIVELLLERFPPDDKDFALEEILRVVRARRARRKTGKYRLDFTRDEAPTDPDVSRPPLDIGDRVTRKVDLAAIAETIKKKREP